VGTGDLAVQWSVNGILGGDAVNGTVVGGKYNSPTTIPPTNPVTITVASVADPTKSDGATLSVFTLTVSPSSVTVLYNHTQQFTATVAGVQNPVVVWQPVYGTADSTGLYTAPGIPIGQNARDILTVNLSNYFNGTGTQVPITLQFPTPVLTSISPNGASAYESVTINGQDMYGIQNVLFPGPFGSQLPANLYTLPTLYQIFATVPIGAVSGNITVNFSVQGVNNTASIPFTRRPNLRIRSGVRDLSSGESVQFQHRLLGASRPSTINWTVDLGNIGSTGLYQAPTVSQESFATVVACLVAVNSCDSTVLRILPLRITPTEPVVRIGQTVQLDALQGSPVSANWSVLAGGGTISTTGLFTAPTNSTQAGGVPVSATASSATATTTIGVTGASPGILSQTYDYMNSGTDGQGFNVQKMEGTLVKSIAVSGNRAYALGFGLRASPPFFANPPFAAIETYDITNPLNPIWLDAREPGGVALNNFGWDGSYRPLVFSTYSHYLFEVDPPFFTGTAVYAPNPIALYDTQSGTPQLVSWAYSPAQLYTANENNGVIYGVPIYIPLVSGQPPPPTVPIYEMDVTSGTIQQTHINIAPPADIVPGSLPLLAIGNGRFVYCMFSTQVQSLEVAAYDASASPPHLAGSVYLAPNQAGGGGPLIRGNLLFWGLFIYDISNGVPVQLGSLPVQIVEDVQGTRLLGRGFLPIYTARNNYLLMDISDPTNPTIKASVYDMPGGIPVATAKFIGNGNSILAAEGVGGIEAIDLSALGGMIDKGRYGAWGATFDIETNQQTMYIAGESGFGTGGLLITDTSTGVPAFDSILQYSQNAALAVKLNNNKAFLGLVDSLRTIDVTNPTSPVETGSVPLPTSALAISGNILFDGTLDGRLVVLNVTNPNSPSILRAISLPAQPTNLRLSGTTLFVADGTGGCLIFDVSNPSAPILLSQITLSTPVWDVALSGNLAFLAADLSGLVVFNVSNPTQPQQVGQQTLASYVPFPYPGGGGAYGLALSVKVQNGLVYVGTANDQGLVFAFDCSHPNYPRLVSMNAIGEFVDTLVSGFSFSGNDVYVFGSLGALDDILQSDNSAPRNVINFFTPPVALFDGSLSSAGFASTSVHAFVHPKFDRNLLQRKHKWPPGQTHEITTLSETHRLSTH